MNVIKKRLNYYENRMSYNIQKLGIQSTLCKNASTKSSKGTNLEYQIDSVKSIHHVYIVWEK